MDTPSTSIASRASKQPLGLVLLDGMRPAFTGLALGIAGGIAASQLIRTLLYDTAPLDAPVFFRVTAILLAVACAGCLIPALSRASRPPCFCSGQIFVLLSVAFS
jgi:hypothetical protein